MPLALPSTTFNNAILFDQPSPCQWELASPLRGYAVQGLFDLSDSGSKVSIFVLCDANYCALPHTVGVLTESKAKATRDELPIHDPARVWSPRRKSTKELLAWYADWRLATLAKIPGCLGMRKLVGTVGWNKHGVMYEFLSLDARNKGMAEVVRRCPAEAEWTEVCVPKLIHAPGSPHIAPRITELEK